MKKRKQLFSRYPEVNGFLMQRVRDLITLDIPYIVSKSPDQHKADFQLSLQHYLEGKNSRPQRIAINYLIEDCQKEIRKSKGNPYKTSLLQLIHELLAEQQSELG